MKDKKMENKFNFSAYGISAETRDKLEKIVLADDCVDFAIFEPVGGSECVAKRVIDNKYSAIIAPVGMPVADIKALLDKNTPPVIRSTMREIKNQFENGIKELFSNIVVFNIEGLYRDIAKYQKKHKELPYLFMNSVTRKALANYVSNEPDITTFEGCKIFIDEDIEYGVVDVR